MAFIRHFNRCIDDNKRSPVIIHHKNVYGDHYPLWTVIDYFSLGMLSRFYSDLKNPDKAYLAKQMYHLNYQTLSSWLFCLTILRNRCAHYARLYYWIFPSMAKRSRKDTFVPDRSLFSQLMMLKELYPTPDDWNREFYLPLFYLVDKYRTSIRLEHIGFPENWTELLIHKVKQS